MGIALVGGCVGPAWGAQAGATFGAVLGVSVGFLAFRWYKLARLVCVRPLLGTEES